MTEDLRSEGVTARAKAASEATDAIELPTAKTIFADGLNTVMPGDAVTKLVFFEEVPNVEGDGRYRVANLILVMPTDRLKQSISILSKILEAEEDESDAKPDVVPSE